MITEFYFVASSKKITLLYALHHWKEVVLALRIEVEHPLVYDDMMVKGLDCYGMLALGDIV